MLIVRYCHHLICPCNGTVIYYMHTIFVAAEVENTNEIFLNLVTQISSLCIKTVQVFFSNKEISKMK